MGGSRAHLTSGRTLVRSATWFFFGELVPLLAAIVALPLIIHSLGVERFGVLAIAWGVIGYFALLDLGIGRALTREVSIMLGSHRDAEIRETARIALLAMAMMGLLGAVPLFLLSPWFAGELFRIAPSLEEESRWVFRLLALLLPMVMATAAAHAVLVAYQRFDILSKVRIPQGLLVYLGPLLVLPFTSSLSVIVGVLLAVRFVSMVVLVRACFGVMPSSPVVGLRMNRLVPLLKMGGWVTVSNVVGPLMVYLDRFVIGALISVSAVAFYVTPYDLVTKLWLIPSAVVATLFPAFSASASHNADRLASLYEKGIGYITIFIFPAVLILSVFAEDGLRLWLGPEFAEQSTAVVQWLAIGVFINSIAHVPFALLQGTGRADLTAKLHIIELPFYVVACVWLIIHYGIIGAAVAWSARVIVDAILLLWLARRLLPTQAEWLLLVTTWMVMVLVWVVGTLLTGQMVKLMYVGAIMVLHGFFVWNVLLGEQERHHVIHLVKWPWISRGSK